LFLANKLALSSKSSLSGLACCDSKSAICFNASSFSSKKVSLSSLLGTLFARPMVIGTEVNSTSGTIIDFTGIPSWVNRITVIFSNVSMSGTSGLALQLGSGSIEATGYTGSTGTGNPQTGAGLWSTDRMSLQVNAVAAQTNSGLAYLVRLASNTWVEAGMVGGSASD